ncbi:MAG: SRPBCC family protein [Sphingobacteriales bacterium]|jgi:ligand-binding SRPBCC domain-containing protein|nr:MAG: SRPBCC family protein [Sphingobacteriales bacterium]
MTIINLQTKFNADINRCFDLSRDVDAHKLTAKRTNETAIAGRTSGLCQLGDKITWEAKHFGIRQRLTVEITKMNPPYFFEDIMLKGAFKSMRHIHTFESKNGHTIMTDEFYYEVPFGILGKIFDVLVLKKYMTNFLKIRNQILKDILES